MARLYFNRPQGKTNAGELAALACWSRLPDDWSVVHGVLYDDEKLGPLSREADFVLLSPTGHLLVVEVKGGDLGHLADTGEWATHDRDNPYWQLFGEYKGLLARLHAAAGTKRIPFLAKALLFPHSIVSRTIANLPGDIPRHIVLDRDDLKNFSGWWRAYLDRLQPLERSNFGHAHDDAEALFLKAFAPGATPAARTEFARFTDELFAQAIEQRFELLDAVEDNPRLIVRGAAGTGKTLIAVEHALRLAARGHRVLFIVFNVALERMLTGLFKRLDATGRPGLDRITLRRLQSLAREVGQVTGSDDEFWGETLPEAALRSGAGLPDERRFDALVIDEAQDITTHLPALPSDNLGWWPFLRALVRPDAPVAVFYDPDQTPTVNRQLAFDPEVVARLFPSPAKLRLPLTHRHTAAIAAHLQKIAEAMPADVRPAVAPPETAPLGHPVVLRPCAPGETASAAAVAIARDWLDRHLCTAEDILFIGLKKDPPAELLSAAQKAGLPIAPFKAPAPDSATYLGVHSAKGIESRAVILFDFPNDPRLLFAGASRARQLLGVIGEG